MSHPNIHQQIEEVDRELRMRASVYPGLIGRGKLRQSEADEQLARLQAVRETLVWCRDNRELVAKVKAGSANA
jgi:antibiotic biosynthesis monooxygenase (ABM) superfamily enzyme